MHTRALYAMKFKKKRLFWFLAPLAIGVMVRYVFSDINLDLDLLRKGLENMPVVVVENLEFEREISGELWLVRTPLAKRRNDIIEFHSMGARRRLANGKEWFLTSLSGIYSETTESADLNDLSGIIETDAHVFSFESPFLSWSKNENLFLFPRGLIIYDAELFLETDLASFDESGIIALNEGAVIRWRKIEK